MLLQEGVADEPPTEDCVGRPAASHLPQLSRVEPGDAAGSRLHLVVHVLGAARTIAAATVPETDEPRPGHAPRQRRVQQPQIAALEGVRDTVTSFVLSSIIAGR